MNSSEMSLLDKSSGALTNGTANSTIAALLSEYTYDEVKMAEGTALHADTLAAWKKNKKESDEKSAAYSDYNSKIEALEDRYRLDRKKGKTVFRKEPETLDKLNLSGSVPKAYLKFMETCETFYTKVNADPAILAKLARMKITNETVLEGLADIEAVKAARHAYQNEKGESEEATREKDAAFEKLDEWMDDFYATAKIALMDHPQLLESLGIRVKS